MGFYAVILRASQGACEAHVHAIAGERISLSGLKLLHILARPHGRPPRISRIGAMLGVTSGAATRVVSTLEEERLVDRIDDEDDGRVKRVLITPKGRALLERMDRCYTGDVQTFIRQLNGEQRELLDAAVRELVKRPDVAELVPREER